MCSLDVQTSKSSISQDLHKVIDKHSKVIEYIPKGLPPPWDHDHAIHSIPGSVPPSTRPYKYPYVQKSSYSALVVMVHKMEVSWCMCPYYKELRNITIQDKFPISVNDELLDELHGVVYITKLDLHSGYHQIRTNE